MTCLTSLSFFQFLTLFAFYAHTKVSLFLLQKQRRFVSIKTPALVIKHKSETFSESPLIRTPGRVIRTPGRVIRTLQHIPLVSVLTWFHCKFKDEPTQREELFTASFNRQNHGSLISRTKSKTPLKA